MADLARRFASNPILRPADVAPSRPDLKVECLLNPGAFRYQGRTGLLMRVAERPYQKDNTVSAPILDSNSPGGVAIIEFDRHDPGLVYADPRIFGYNGVSYLTTLSHLRLAWSVDGTVFTPDASPTLTGYGELEAYGVEDARVLEQGGTYHITYTQVSSHGIGVGYISTHNWVDFERHGMIFPPTNKDCALFPEKIGGAYAALHRPVASAIGGPYIWFSTSPDRVHWGNHQCIARTRAGLWDEQRIGAGAEPIRTEAGWLVIYHGADNNSRYCLGAMLLAHNNPAHVLARSTEPIMEPTAPCERTGFFGNVVFSNGQIVEGDTVTSYYGASDEIICGATFSIREILTFLGV